MTVTGFSSKCKRKAYAGKNIPIRGIFISKFPFRIPSAEQFFRCTPIHIIGKCIPCPNFYRTNDTGGNSFLITQDHRYGKFPVIPLGDEDPRICCGSVSVEVMVVGVKVGDSRV